MQNRTLRRILGAVALLLFLAGPVHAADVELARDGGTRESHQSMAGSGHVVAFETTKGEWWLRQVRVHGQRYGGGYDPKAAHLRVAVCDSNLNPIATFEFPYAHFGGSGFAWVDLDLPRAILVPPSFKVAVSFDPTQHRGVFVGWAKTTSTHSTRGLPGGEEQAVEAGREWMIRAVVTKKPPRGMVKERLLRLDDGEKTGKQSLGGSAHVLHFKRPKGTWWIASVQVYGQLYGGGYDPCKTKFLTSITNKGMKTLTEQAAPYALFSRKAFGWADVPLLKPIKAPASFRVVVDFNPNQTRGVYLGYTKAGKSHSLQGRAGGSASPFAKGQWMIRVRLTSEEPEPPEAIEVPGRGAQAYTGDFEFLARTVRDNFPSFEKKGVDWEAVCGEFEPLFAACKDDETHLLNATKMLAVLGDMHTGVADTEIRAHVPAFDGLYGAGMWIATEGDHLRLRAIMPDHVLAKTLPVGSLLAEVDGSPARLVHQAVREKLRTWHGWSSTHFLDARLSFQFFPFGEKQKLKARFVAPDGEPHEVELPRWGPGGKGLSRAARTMPNEVEAKGLAVAKLFTPYIGYVRILGSMNAATEAAFNDALEKVKGVQGLVLDCRGMGGGGDGPAWKMAGRFFANDIPWKRDPVLKPSGSWQYEGPLVMLTDEREVSSAETFTWALAETKRAVTVGRPTGGATIIPRTFTVPSGAFSFRLGCRDRETSVAGVQPEGVGTAPDVHVPYDGVILQRYSDPVLAAGYDLVRVLAGGAPRAMATDIYGGILGADPMRTRRAWTTWQNYPRPEDLLYKDLTAEFVDQTVEGLALTLEATGNRTPDVLGAGERLRRMGEIADVLGRADAATRAHKTVSALRQERGAQEIFHEILERGFPPSEEELDKFCAAFEGTRWADAVAAYFED